MSRVPHVPQDDPRVELAEFDRDHPGWDRSPSDFDHEADRDADRRAQQQDGAS